MTEDGLRKLLVVQRRRLVGTILGYGERELYPHLSKDQQQGFRNKVLGAVESYHDLVMDIVGVSEDDTVLVNAEAMELLRDIREQVSREAAQMTNSQMTKEHV